MAKPVESHDEKSIRLANDLCARLDLEAPEPTKEELEKNFKVIRRGFEALRRREWLKTSKAIEAKNNLQMLLALTKRKQLLGDMLRENKIRMDIAKSNGDDAGFLNEKAAYEQTRKELEDICADIDILTNVVNNTKQNKSGETDEIQIPTAK